jgi:hypothetical protein
VADASLAGTTSGEHGSLPWMSETSFDQVITEHLTLAERNKRLERTMPLERYREQGGGEIADDPLSRQVEPSAEADAVPRADPESWWETADGECPPPPIDWDNG